MSCRLVRLEGRDFGLTSGVARMRRPWLSTPLPEWRRPQHHSPASSRFSSAMTLCDSALRALIVVCTHHQVWQQDGPLLLCGRCRAGRQALRSSDHWQPLAIQTSADLAGDPMTVSLSAQGRQQGFCSK